ncbi:MAG TPA: methionine--tRNA ligase [Candidatus Acidoferrales bacterium]|nr:methionine--tRNA ligase [Candidatus Acidoferrales bacterium]
MNRASSSKDKPFATGAQGKPKFYLTTPIYYANSRPHVGSAYTTIVCDVIARYKRMCGYDVAYLTGTDEHGVNIERAAEARGITPQQIVDQNEKIFRDLWKLLGISDQPYFHFVRTHSPEHERAVQRLVQRTLDRDKDLPLDKRSIYKAKYEGRYCIYDNAYVSDTPEPVNCPTCGRPAELISEENYFFRLSAYQDKLLDLYENHRTFVQPDFRRNEVQSFVESGLKDVSISRKAIKWGVPWPGDPEHVFYVWYEALTSYMTGIGYASENKERKASFERFWPADLHMIGKEIIRFHAVYWPAFLMAADMPLPKQIFAHGWLLFEQEKMSKSKGNVAYPEPIVKVLGNDALRYYLLREVVFGQDGNFSREALITRYNADLANGLGNLASRVLTMIDRYCGGRVPDPGGQFDFQIKEMAEFIAGDDASAGGVRGYFDEFDFSRGLEALRAFTSMIDGRLTTVQPWTLAADTSNRESLAIILYSAVEGLRFVAALAHPVIPDGTRIIWKELGQQEELAAAQTRQLKWGELKPGTQISKPEAVFPRADYQEASERIEAMENEIRNAGATPTAASASGTAGGAAPAAAPATDGKITIEEFAKVELRVGVVKSAERIPGADKLLKLLVDVGDEVRQVLAGIALAYAPEDLVGRKVVIVVNLAPRKMRGLESNGMLLAASADAAGKPVLCTFAEDIPAGAKVK